jgi:hypothetical protein
MDRDILASLMMTEDDIQRVRPKAWSLLEQVPGAVGPTGGGAPRQLEFPFPQARKPGIRAYHGSPDPNLTAISGRHGVEAPGATFHASNRDAAEPFTSPREYGEPVYEDASGNPLPQGRVYDTELSPRYPYEVPAAEAQKFIDDTAHQTRVLNEARRKGHDAVVARNVDEGFGGSSVRTDVYAALKDEIVRLLRGD